jgi:hypothetical protein
MKGMKRNERISISLDDCFTVFCWLCNSRNNHEWNMALGWPNSSCAGSYYICPRDVGYAALGTDRGVIYR